MQSLKNRKLSALQNTSDSSPEYLVCKTNWAHSTIPPLAGPWVPLRAFKGICCLNPSPVGCVDRPGSLSAEGPSPFIGCCFYLEASTAMLSVPCLCLVLCLSDPEPDLQADTPFTSNLPCLHRLLIAQWWESSLASWPCSSANSLPALAKVLALTTPLNTGFLQTRIPALVNF